MSVKTNSLYEKRRKYARKLEEAERTSNIEEMTRFASILDVIDEEIEKSK